MNGLKALVPAPVLLFAVVTLTAGSAAGQTPADLASRIRELEAKVERLRVESEALRAELAQLRAAMSDDLTAVAPLAPQPAPASVPPPEDLGAALVENQPAPAGRNVLNPDISVIGTLAGHGGDRNPFDGRPSALFEEAEIGFQAFVDPYAQARIYLAVTPEGAEVEEAYASFIALPRDFTAKAGKLKAAFGKVNLMHTHVRPWVDYPLVVRNFFGDEGLRDSGVSVSRLFANRAGLFVEGTAEVYSGDAEGVFEAQNRNDLLYLAHLKGYGDLSERSNLEIGASWARGTVEEGASRLAGLDVTYRYKPLERAIYRSFVARAEIIANDRDGAGDRAIGYYASADYQLARRWFAGLRIDRADHLGDAALRDRGASLMLTFWPSEFSQFRAQARRTRYRNGPAIDEVLLQLQFAIGAHGAHSF